MAGLRFDYEDAVRFLVARGVEEDVLSLSSIPEHHLRFIRATILEQLRPRRHPLISLHIGNFVGISLAAYVDALRTVSRLTTVIAIDPNIVAAGIKNPQEHVIELLARYDLLSSVLLLTGYSFERTEFAPNDLTEELSPSGTDALPQLGRLPVRFDSALVVAIIAEPRSSVNLRGFGSAFGVALSYFSTTPRTRGPRSATSSPVLVATLASATTAGSARSNRLSARSARRAHLRDTTARSAGGTAPVDARGNRPRVHAARDRR
jgi:hypothetical protein